ncbi:MAG: amidohydrolase family protein [Tepidisphaeraceae bacterium]
MEAPTPASSLSKPPDHNRAGVDFRAPLPRPKVRGLVIDFHTHLLAARHAALWFQTASHYGIDAFVTMAPLEETMVIQRDWPGRVQFIAVPSWQDPSADLDNWLRRIEMFHNIGSRIVKFHMAPGTIAARKWRLDAPEIRRLIDEAVGRGMMIMTHVGDPDTWYAGKYADAAKYGTRDEHYQMWEGVLAEYPNVPWVGAHMGGNPENLDRLQRLLDRFSNLYLDNSATRWMVREISARRDEARDFLIRNQDRILFGSDQVSTDDRGFDFLASRWWSHRKLWETAYSGPAPIFDPDLAEDKQPRMRGLALPDVVLQKIYHDNPVRLLASVGTSFEGWG